MYPGVTIPAAGCFDSPVTHVEAEVQRGRALMRLQVARDRSLRRLPPRADARDRGYISDDAVDAALAAGSDESERGHDRRWGSRPG